MAESMAVLFLFISSVVYLLSSAAGVIFAGRPALAIRVPSLLSFLAGALGVFAGAAGMTGAANASFSVPFPLFPEGMAPSSLGVLSFRIDPFASLLLTIIFFIASVCSVYSSEYLKEYAAKGRAARIAFFAPIFVVSMAGVAVADHVVSFLVFWELMSLASYFLVMTDSDHPRTCTAGFTYLVMTHFGTAFLLFFFAMMFSATGSLAFTDFAAARAGLDAGTKTLLFFLLLMGFGTKAGLVPLHIWLPLAHPQAPSHVSALMSGVMIKVALFAFIRFTFEFLGGASTACSIFLLAVGAVTAAFGVMYASVDTDLKRSLAYSTVENAGIITIAFACSLVLRAAGNQPGAVFALAAALFHCVSHAAFKSLLFLNAGAVIHAAGTRNMEEMGGLVKKMPRTSMNFLAGAMSMSALPPMAGFFSEWMIFQSIILAMGSGGPITGFAVPVAGAVLALASSLASFCAVRNMFSVFLGRRRGHKYSAGHEEEPGGAILAPMWALSAVGLLAGVFCPYLVSFLGAPAGAAMLRGGLAPVDFAAGGLFVTPAVSGASSVAPPVVFLMLIALVFGLKAFTAVAGLKLREYETWSCGADLDETMEYTPESYSQPLTVVFNKVYMPRTDISTTHFADRLLLKRVEFHHTTTPVFETYFYKPLTSFVFWVSGIVKRLQVGFVHVYLMYIFATLVALLLAARLL